MHGIINIWEQYSEKQLKDKQEDFVRKFMKRQGSLGSQEADDFMRQLCHLFISCSIKHRQRMSSWGIPTLIAVGEQFEQELKETKRIEFWWGK